MSVGGWQNNVAMAKKVAPLLPSTEELLRLLGERLRLARLRRRLTAKQVAERAGMAPMTLRSLERGGSGVTMGAYLAVMQVLGIEKDIDLLAKDDPLGRELQDSRLPSRARANTRATEAASMPAVKETAPDYLPEPATGLPARQQRPPANPRATKSSKSRKSSHSERDWIKESGFADAQTLAGLLKPAVKKRS